VGLEVRIEGVPYRFAGRVAGGWQLVRLSDNLLENKQRQELWRLYVAGLLIYDVGDAMTETEAERVARRQRHLVPLDDRSAKEQQRARSAHKIIQAVDDRMLPGDRCRTVDAVSSDGTPLFDRHGVAMVDSSGKPKRVLRLALELRAICTELGFKTPISVATYYRMAEQYGRSKETHDLIPNFSGRGNRKQLPDSVQDFLRLEIALVLNGRPASGLGAMDVKERVEARIDAANAANPAEKLKKPSDTTYYNWWKETPAYDRAVLRFGKVRADHLFRSVRGHKGPEHSLDVVEFDETPLPLFLVDEELGVPLGRATLAWWIDVRSQYPLGFYLGYEPPSDLVIASSLRHAILPKAYVRDEYPEITHDWLSGGIPRLLIFDNGLAQHAHTIESIAFELDIYIKYAKVRTPWFKATVERTFGIVLRLLREIPGYSPSLDLKISKKDYDPATDAVMGLRQFLLILHKWLIDDYCQKQHETYGSTPEQRYREGTQVFEPEFLDDATKLDSMFGIVRKGTLDHRGVCYENLWYQSEALELLLRRDAICTKKRAAAEVRVKVNPGNLSMVHVWDRKCRCWIRCLVNLTNRDYASGLSLHCHKLYRTHSQEQYQLDEPAGYEMARREIRELIARTLPKDLSIRTNTLIARALGLGTQNIFDNLSIGGRFTQMTGPFGGQSLNPFVAAPSSSAGVPDKLITEASLETGCSTPCAASPSPQRRTIPTFVTDRSLAKRN
jgi:putative transposase